MKKLFLVAMGILLSASVASAFDIKGQAMGAASDLASGKSVKDIANEKKEEAKKEAQKEVEKKADEALKKADSKTGGTASTAAGMLKK